MKKKRNLLTIISSILGIFVICGAFCCSLFIGSNKKATQSKAAITYQNFYTNLMSDSFASNTNYLNSSGEVVDVTINGSFNLVGRTRIALNDNNNTSEVQLYYYLTFSGSLVTEFIEDGEWIFNRNLDFSVDCYFPVNRGNVQYKGLFDIRTKFYESDGLRMYLYVNGDLYSGVIYDRLNGDTGNANGLIYYYSDNNIYSGFINNTLNTYSVFSFNYDFDISPYSQGYNDGFLDGLSQGEDKYYDLGYADGSNDGYNQGYDEGVEVGEILGYESGYDAGVASQQSLIQNAYDSGYSDGFNEADSVDSTAVTIFSGILQVALVPINFFLAIFNFEILGINLSAFIKALFTVVITIIVLRTVIGGGSNDN